MHVLLAAEDAVPELCAEVERTFPRLGPLSRESALLPLEIPLVSSRRLPYLAYARQWLPEVLPVRAESIRVWAEALFRSAVDALPENGSWRLHVQPHYDSAPRHRIGARAWHSAGRFAADARASRPGHHQEAGRQRCSLIGEALDEILQRKRRHLLRQLQHTTGPFRPEDSLVQLLLTSPEEGLISVASAPLPFEQRHILSPFPKGKLDAAVDKSAPSRAFTKLLEAEARLGRRIKTGETCVDLGAAPGSWTYVVVQRGARVIAVDRSPLTDSLMRNRLVDFRTGDAFQFEPSGLVDWLLCDVIAPPELTGALLHRWLERRWCRHFVVTVKMKDASGIDALQNLKSTLPPLCSELFLTHLCANKKEVCAFGSVST